MTADVLVTVASQWRRALPPPPGELDRAVDAVRRLSQQIEDETAFGFLEPALVPVTGGVDEDLDLRISCAGHLTIHPSNPARLTIAWRWAKVASYSDGWYDLGWHPDGRWSALNKARRRALWTALNPLIKTMPP